MNTKTCTALIAFGLASCVFAADNALEQTLRELDGQWSKAAGAKDLNKTVSFYSTDAIVLPPNEPSITGAEAIKAMWKGFFDEVASLSWTPTRVEIAKSGDMAYITGTYDEVAKDASGKSTNDHGKYLEVWEKQADGSWKCGADMFSSDSPAPGSSSTEKK